MTEENEACVLCARSIELDASGAGALRMAGNDGNFRLAHAFCHECWPTARTALRYAVSDVIGWLSRESQRAAARAKGL